MSTTKKSVGVKGKILRSQAREIIANVLQFMREEAEHGLKIPLANFKKRLLEATKISDKCYRKIQKEAEDVQTGAAPSFSTPRKNRPRSSPKSSLSEGEMEAIRSIIHNYSIIEKRQPSLKGKVKH